MHILKRVNIQVTDPETEGNKQYIFFAGEYAEKH